MNAGIDAPDLAPGLTAAFARVPAEGSRRLEVTGTIPPFVRGTLLMNGPAQFARGPARYRHWLDGDGMVCRVAIDGDEARLTATYVRSRKRLEEEAAGRPLFRTFGTAFAGDRLCRGVGLESPVNISVVPYAGGLLALGEQGLPLALDPASLETRGPFTFNGALNEVSPFSAHPKIDHDTGELFNFGVSFSSDRPLLHVYRFGADARLRYRRRLPLPYACSLHDFSLGPRHLCFHLSPYLLDVSKVVNGTAPLLDALTWQPERGSRVWVVDRADGSLLHDIAVPPRYVLHHAGCSELNGAIALDIVELECPVYPQYILEHLFERVASGRAVRLLLDANRGAVIERQESSYSAAPDFPITDTIGCGTPYRRLWMLGISKAGCDGRKFFDELVEVDWRQRARPRIYRLPAGCYFAGEPVFVRDPVAADGGALLCPMLDVDTERTIFGIWDARDITRGPCAQLTTSPALHLMFHGVFVAAGVG